MTTPATHTPTPWMECPVKASDGTASVLCYEIIAPKVDGGEGEPLIVARCWTKEDMQAIVRAVNAHEALLKLDGFATHKLSCKWRNGRPSNFQKAVCDCGLEDVRAAIAKAEGRGS